MKRVESWIPKIARAFVGALALLAGIGVPAQAADKVRLQNNWVWTANIAAFMTAIDKGYYKEEGLDVVFQEGKGSSFAIQQVGAKNMDFAVADLAAAALTISQGVPVQAVFCHIQATPSGIIARKDANIKTPKDLEGKRLGFSPADSGWAIFPALAAANGVDLSKITKVSASPAARRKLLAANTVDAIVAYPDSDVPRIRATRELEVTSFAFGDFGVNLLGPGVVAHQDTLEQKPDLVRRFVRSSLKGFARAKENPGEAIEFLAKRAPLTVQNKEVSLEILKGALSLLHSKRSRGKPLGWMAAEDWDDTLQILARYREMKRLPSERYYTNRFIEGGG